LRRFCGWPVKLRAIGEFDLITQNKSPLLVFLTGGIQGRGNVSAVSTLFSEYQIDTPADLFVEEVYFDLSFLSPYPFDRKRLPVGVGDIVAIGARPRLAFFHWPILSSYQLNSLLDFGKVFYAKKAVCGISVAGENDSVATNPSPVRVTYCRKGKEEKMGGSPRRSYPVRPTFRPIPNS
jgi:hypothetical protein